jgi:Zn-dependent peptidase ImmA (M78 family)
VNSVETRMRQRRDRVRQLHDDGRSLRDIAAELGVSKDTVRRDLYALKKATQAAPAALLLAVDGQLRKDLNLLTVSYRAPAEDVARYLLHEAAEEIRRRVAARFAAGIGPRP